MDATLHIKTPAELGVVLRETRVGLQVPALDVAAVTGISPTTLRRLEQGKATEAIQALFRLFDELGIECRLAPPQGIPAIEFPPGDKAPVRRRVSR